MTFLRPAKRIARHALDHALILFFIILTPYCSLAQHSSLMDEYKTVGDIWGKHGKAYDYYLNDMLKNRSIDMQMLNGFGTSVTEKLGNELRNLEQISTAGKDADLKNAIMDYCRSAIRYIDKTNDLMDNLKMKGTFNRDYYQEIAGNLNTAAVKMARLARESEEAEQAASAPREAPATATPSVQRFPSIDYFERFSVKAPSGKGEKYGVKNGAGKIVIPADYDWMGTMLRYPEDDARDKANAFGFFARLGNKNGFIRNDGKVIVPVQYDIVGHVSEGRIFVGLKGKYGYVDTTGKLVVPLLYKYDMTAGEEEGSSITDEIVYYKNGYAIAFNGSKYGLIDRAGKVIVPLKYDKVTDMQNGYCVVTSSAGDGLLDKTGKEVLKPGPRQVLGYPYANAVIVKQNGKFAVMSIISGAQKVLPYDDVIYGFNTWGLACVQSGEKTGFINAKGNVVIPAEYIYLKDFTEGMIPLVRSYNGKFAYFDSAGKAVTDFVYDETLSFSEGLAAVQRNKKWGSISKRGAEEIPVRFDYLASFQEGLACAGTFTTYSRKFGFIDHSGTLVIPYEYDTPANFVNGKAYISKGGQWFYIDRNGKRLN